MTSWNYAEWWERVADRFPDAQAQVHDDRRYTWAEFDRRADGLAQTFLDAGAEQQDKIALYLYNGPEYLETCFGAFKAGLVPVNTNYRYREDELVYLWDNADAIAVAFHGAFTSRIESIRDRLPKVGTWLWVDDDTDSCPDWAEPYEKAVAAAGGRVTAPWGRGDDDILMIYTGGTTGMPKGVMWRHDDLIRSTVGATNFSVHTAADHDELVGNLTMTGVPGIPACPLMHGTGWFTAMMYLCNAGSVVTLPSRNFDVEELLDTIQAEKVGALTIVGDAFAKPMLKALDAEPDRWDLSSLVLITSSGVMWSESVKQGLLGHHSGMFLIDAFSSSEAIGLGQSVSAGGAATKTAKFDLGQNARVITDDGRDVEPGSGERGRVAVRGFTPTGYYKDPEKSAATFLTIDGERYSIPGDYAMVEADGSITLLGRGSVCINTAGEKVFPEEVEEILKEHADVNDAVVVGVPDEKFGEAITAIVEPNPGHEVDEAALIAFVKDRLAAFKAPKRVLAIDTIGRAPNAKVDYKRMKQYALDQLDISA